MQQFTAITEKTGLIHNLLCWLSCLINVLLFGGRYWQTTSAHIGRVADAHGGCIKFEWSWRGVWFYWIWKLTELTDNNHAVEAFDRELTEQINRLRRLGRI